MRTQKGKILLVAIGMSCILGLPVEASENFENNYNEGASVQYVQTVIVQSILNISGGNAKCQGTISAPGKSCNITATLQKKTSSGWKNIKTWKKSGNTSCSIIKTEPVSKGVKYRLKVVGKSGTDSSTRYSAIKSY